MGYPQSGRLQSYYRPRRILRRLATHTATHRLRRPSSARTCQSSTNRGNSPERP
nr:MAG TPA: hypothetical protein [Caudoviricetes sp.]